MPAPTIRPEERPPAEVSPTDAYQPDDRVWIYRDGTWRPGVVEDASAYAATVIYRSGCVRGTGVDIRTAPYVLLRAEADPFIDCLTRS
jgi:hypothetical protein